MKHFPALLLAACALGAFAPAASRSEDTADGLRVPAFTAYSEPNPEALSISKDDGVTGWQDKAQKVVWYGKIAAPGKLEPSLALRLPGGSRARLKLTVASQSVTAEATGAEDGKCVPVPFGAMYLPAPGYYRFMLEGVSKTGATFGDVEALLLRGEAARGAHFNLLAEQRGAPSVHLSYPLPKNTNARWFYCEASGKTDPLWTYYMACGWHRGYFGMQVNSPTERRIIFSVWDSGNEAVDRNKVSDANRVKLLAKGDGVFVDSFGNEGTGGHSHLVYNWKTGQTYRFLVSAEPDGTATVYTGYFYFPEKKQWGLIARFRAPKDGGYMRGLYSFDEDWNSPNGQMTRRAEFGGQWIKTPEGRWLELTTAYFTHTGKDSRTDYDAGSVGSRFYLTGGGFKDGHVQYRDMVQRGASGKPPTDIVLPE